MTTPRDLRRRAMPNDKWTCPWCQSEAAEERVAICEARRCSCGAVALGAPGFDFEEILADAQHALGFTTSAESRLADHLELEEMLRGGIEIWRGARAPGDSGLEYVYYWFRRRPETDAAG